MSGLKVVNAVLALLLTVIAWRGLVIEEQAAAGFISGGATLFVQMTHQKYWVADCLREYQSSSEFVRSQSPVSSDSIQQLGRKGLVACGMEFSSRIAPNLVKAGAETVYVPLEYALPYEIVKWGVNVRIAPAADIRCGDYVKSVALVCPKLVAQYGLN